MGKATAAWALVAAMTATGMSHAETPFTLERDGPGVDFVLLRNLWAPRDYGVLRFSEDWTDTLDQIGAVVSPLALASTGMDAGELETLTLPLQRVHGLMEAKEHEYESVRFSALVFGGGFSVTIGASAFSKGGTMTVTNLVLDVEEGGLFADVVGGNGLGLQGVRLGDLSWAPLNTTMTFFGCAAWHLVPCHLQFAQRPELSVQMTDEAVDVFARSLNLRAGGVAMMEGISVMGEFKVSPVPEPGTLVSMMLGLSGMGWLALRRSRTSPRSRC